MREVFEKIIERMKEEFAVNPYARDCIIKIINQVAEEYSHGHFGCNSNGEHEKCDGCGIAPECKEKYKHWFGVSGQWIPADEPPKDNKYVLLSFANFPVPLVGRFEEDPDGSGAYYLVDEDVPLVLQDMIVNAWMPLPKPYNPDESMDPKPQTNADRIRAMSDEELTKIIMCPYDTAGAPIDIMPCVTELGTQELVSPEFCQMCMMKWLQREVEENEQFA